MFFLLKETHSLGMTAFEERLYASGCHSICGIDEVGRGPLAGPVIAAAVILPEKCLISGIRDSKRLSPRQREFLFDQIQREARAIGIGVVDNEIIDQINILQATLLAMEKSVDALRIEPDYLLIDALTLPNVCIPQNGIIHGDDRSVSIAAASIIAKVTRDRLMYRYHEEFPLYQFNQHKGYGTEVHRQKLKELGPCRLHRKTFRGVLV